MINTGAYPYDDSAYTDWSAGMSAVSLCAECDAPPGECHHAGARYLEPIVYEKAEGGGWIVPVHERERWESGPATRYLRQPATLAASADDAAIPVQQLIVELEAWIDLDPHLERLLRETYEREPLRATRAARSASDAAQGGFPKAAGLLYNRLKAIL